MGNRLFQQARNYYEIARQHPDGDTIAHAKNALSSAFADSTAAEQEQLRKLQNELDKLSN